MDSNVNSGYFSPGAVNGALQGPPGADATWVPGRAVEHSEDNGNWILLTTFVILLVFRVISFRNALQSLKQSSLSKHRFVSAGRSYSDDYFESDNAAEQAILPRV